jgi:hypothetical protein
MGTRCVANEAWFCQAFSSTLLSPKSAATRQLPTKSGDVGLQRAEFGVRQVAALQLRHARLGDTHKWPRCRLFAVVSDRFGLGDGVVRGGWLASDMCAYSLAVQQTLRVDTAGVQAMAVRWGASVGILDETVAPEGLGLSCQASAAAVDAAHVDVAAFTAGLAARVGVRATGVAQADTHYLAQEAVSATELAALAPPVTSV